jgi:hypothetical protein
MRSNPLTAVKLQMLRRVAQREVSGKIENGAWIYRCDGRVCTAVVMALSARGLVSIERGIVRASIIETERGRAVLAKGES